MNLPRIPPAGVPAVALTGAASPPSGALPGGLKTESPKITAIVSRKDLGDRKNMIINEIWPVTPQNILTISRESLILCERGGTTI
jgi:hypothetical protein